MATIREIAERAGFSPATVSRILNDDSSLSVKEATRQKVLNASLELGYENVPRYQRVTIPQGTSPCWTMPFRTKVCKTCTPTSSRRSSTSMRKMSA